MDQTSLPFCTFLSHQMFCCYCRNWLTYRMKITSKKLHCTAALTGLVVAIQSYLKAPSLVSKETLPWLLIGLCLDMWFCVYVCVQRQILWALCCWRRASTALSVTTTRFTSFSRSEARSRLPTRARPRCPGLPESARSEGATSPNTVNHNHINGFTEFGKLILKKRQNSPNRFIAPARSWKERVEMREEKSCQYSKCRNGGII